METDSIIYSTAVGAGIPSKLAALLVAQARHETGNYTSRFFRDYNNAFGYTYAGSKYQVGAGPVADNNQPIGAYRNVADSTMEIVDWIKRRVREGKFPADLGTITTPEHYAQLLKSAGYFGDTLQNYTAGLKRFYDHAKDSLATGSPFSVIIGGMLLVGVAWAIKKS